jgi:hypothetical protein
MYFFLCSWKILWALKVITLPFASHCPKTQSIKWHFLQYKCNNRKSVSWWIGFQSSFCFYIILHALLADYFMLVSCLAYCSTLKMEVTCSSKMLVDFLLSVDYTEYPIRGIHETKVISFWICQCINMDPYFTLMGFTPIISQPLMLIL